MKTILVDVDIAWKICIYGLVSEFIESATLDQTPALLEISKYTLRTRLRNPRSVVDDTANLREAVKGLLTKATLLRPTAEEIELAAEFEEKAIQQSLELDTGESQLLAVLMYRNAPLLLTGDKRAIQAIHSLAIADIDGRIACLEQMMTSFLATIDCGTLRNSVCNQPKADTAMTICFGCSSPQVTEAVIRSGLDSYINNLRQSTSSLLIASFDLFALLP